ncbi:alpha/beta hydrolase [Mycobacterium sp. CVI_P3]|uniref:Alpha/beta hydrolase n=1 Tax=Mycobacterium pinniadriaticum TaxID=2994102 RepID=A0ABT3SKL2_9MYCO|nr:alpha/beta hydrolase [Mycobacterium pinniadriaticum]MCX2933644.1 alpha/beta hydrolase [Mycobacterium pinniadriaticum]MCX2940069.1 alpha/beta hydrolase [Mycobacterium pinniadriaticum]
MTPIATYRLTVAGITTSVLDGGAGVPDEAVVFVHGNPDSGSDWMPLMTMVAEFTRVVAPDLPGFGAAGPRVDRDYTVTGYARFLEDLIGQLDIERVHLVAHDFGGPIAAAWAAEHPGRVASVTFINTGVLTNYRWHRMARVWRTPLLGELAMRFTTLGVARALLAHDNPGLSPAWVDTVAGHLMPSETKRAVLKLYRSTSIRDVEALAPRLRRHDHDALVVFGDADVYIPVEQAHRQRQAFPRAEIHVLPGVGHWSWLEQTEQVAAHVVPFLRDRVGCARTTKDQPLQGGSQ